jgi:hypothetical protein
MEITRFEDYKGGWFVGNFIPTAFDTKDFEVCYKKHKKGEKWETHYHKVSTEINLLVEGEMVIQNNKLRSGDVFVIKPYEVADPDFLTDCTVLIIKTPSDTNDKYIIKNK